MISNKTINSQAHIQTIEMDENVLTLANTTVHSNSHTKSLKSKAFLPTPSSDRKSLQVLQVTADNKLSRKTNELEKADKISMKKTFKIFQEFPGSTPKSSVTKKTKECTHASTQTESEDCFCTCHEKHESVDDEAFRLMGAAETSKDYWKDVADTRKNELEDSLLENELLTCEISELKKENERLSELAGNAEYFAKVLKDLTEEKEDSDVSEDSDRNDSADASSSSVDNSTES